MATYRDMKRRLANVTRDGVLSAYARDATADDLAYLVATGNMHEYALADIALAAVVGAAPLGLMLDVEAEYERLRDAVGTILDDTEHETEMQLARLGEAEPLAAAQTAWNEGMDAHPQVTGWTRVTGPDPCPLCRGLETDDPLPASVPMLVPHPGCGCTAEPVGP